MHADQRGSEILDPIRIDPPQGVFAPPAVNRPARVTGWR
jgi:hypothetical protein